ncbi:hypothetical protein V0U79_09905 [Hyphobacterium sp. HN65]|uniref:Uncharacterized protein n=1 Tax=Hyphobacterium lacteum TaxID=3116575 RepID=A0ABU7LRY1_9PROT|nr:hypothetical protein [Hyphobacterium sp. HN65]MEE2526682.1 hypothetical protein [Hyphobacterium sp. HN65]
MTQVTYTDRRNAASPEQLIALEDTRISVSENGTLKRAIAFTDIVEVRMGVEMAGRDSQIVCRITGKDGTRVIFGSRAWTSIGVWKNQADRFLAFNACVHRTLAPFGETIRFVEGQPLWFGFVMSGLGLLIALMGGGFAIYLALEESPLFAGGIPGIIIGVYLAWMFKPRAPKPYDPDIYAGKA